MQNNHDASLLSQLWSPLAAVTTVHEGRTNGQIAVTALGASILRERPRVLIELWKANLTHDLVLASGVFALHLLRSEPEEGWLASLDLVRTLGLRSGHAGDKMGRLRTRVGVTGSPILLDSLGYVEARVFASIDCGDMTTIAADVLDGSTFLEGEPLTLARLRRDAPGDVVEAWQGNREQQRASSRRLLDVKES